MLAIVVAFAPAAHAATYWVDASNPSCSNAGAGSPAQPYCSIAAAVAARAGPGNTILVQPGVYAEQVTVTASGTAASPFALRAAAPGVVVDGSDDFGASDLWAPASGGAWLAASVANPPLQVFADGARLAPAPPGTTPDQLPARAWTWVAGAGLYVDVGGDSPAAHRARVGRRSYGIRLDRRSWVTVEGFTVRHCESRGIYLTGPLTGTVVSDNVATHCAKNGIAAYSCSSIVIRRNVCSDHLDHGIYLNGTTASIIEDNESTRNARLDVRAANGMNLNRSTRNLIQRNRFHHNQDTGLDFSTGANDNLARLNLLDRNGDHGADHVDCSGNVHVGDVAYRNYKDGFSFEGNATGHQVWNCIGIENGIAVRAVDGSLEYDLYVDESSVPGFRSDYNVWWNSTPAPPIKFGGMRRATLAEHVAATGQDAHSIQANPLFADTSRADFRLRDGSPAIDSGTSDVPGWSAADFEGRARWDHPGRPNAGAGPVPFTDRGAFEFLDDRKPVAALALDVPFGGAPHTLTASAAASTDGDRGPALYTFDFGDGTIVGPQASPLATHSYAAIGDYVVMLTATSDRGTVDTCAAPVVVVANHASNPGFESGAGGWSRYGTATLTAVAGGRSGGAALQVKGGSSSSSLFGVEDAPNAVTLTAGMGSRYRFGAWVRSASHTGKVTLEVREYLGTTQKGSTAKSIPVTLAPAWRYVTVDYTVTTDGTTLDLRVVDAPNRSSETWLLDDVSVALLWAPPAPPPPLPGNLVANASFESAPAGWTKYGSATWARVLGGRSGGYALEVKGGSSSSALFGLDDSPNWVARAAGPGARYRFAAWVRSATSTGKLTLEVRELLGSTQKGATTRSAPVTLSPAWQPLTADHVVTTAGTTLDLRIVDAPNQGYEKWLLDDVAILPIAPDRAPVVTAPESVAVFAGRPIAVHVAASDPDAEAIAALAADLGALPAGHGATFTVGADRRSGVLEWTPATTDARAAPYRVAFTASNGLAGTAFTAIVVADSATADGGGPAPGESDRPPLVGAPDSLVVMRGSAVTIHVTADDPDGQAIDSLAADLTGLPPAHDATFTVDAERRSATLRWTPRAEDVRSTPWIVAFTAGNALSGSARSAITVVDTAATFPLPAPPPANLVANSGFESGLQGWGTYGTAALARVAGGHSGDWALEITGSGSFGCDDVPNGVGVVAGAGARYRVSAWVRSASHAGKVKIRIYEMQGGSQVGSTVYSQILTLGPAWQELVAEHTVLQAGSALSIRVTDAAVASRETFLVDDVSITTVAAPARVVAAEKDRGARPWPRAEPRAFVLGEERLAFDDASRPFTVRVEGLAGPAWEGVVPRVALRCGSGDVPATLRFGEDANRDGHEELAADFDPCALRAALGEAGERDSAEVTLVATAGETHAWSTPLRLAIEPAPRVFAASFVPQPTRGDGALTFTLTRPGFARIDLYDASGRRVRRLFERDGLAPGRFHAPLEGTRLAAGIYFYRIEALEGTLTGRVVIVR